MNPDDNEIRAALEKQGMLVIEGEIPATAPPPLSAILAVTGFYVQATVSIPQSDSDVEDQVDRHWHEQANRIRLYGDDGKLLLRLSDPSSEARGWIQVKDLVNERLPSRVAMATGYREFIAVSLDGKELCAVSIEDEEDWIVTHHFS
ncbi:hypothetical protein OHB49_10375 [Streptomyces sp. NBC_01717]|uniref:hypothetical protein n=1 Tax=Streptomyces sp. NBC_01717 TaxID=2975918 RepID=UPI002E37588A|nr:hypothetical protein [Streptomyces sp. NBC_01717]